MFNHVMLDLETLGTTPGSVIFAIGAVVFPSNVRLSDDWEPVTGFSIIIQRQSAIDAGLTEDSRTIAWWEKQDDAAYSALRIASAPPGSSSALPIAVALHDFADWFASLGAVAGIWGNGAAFDLSLLAEAYRRCGFGSPPWNHRQERCYRTLKSLPMGVPFVNRGIAHNAYDDAVSQAFHANHILACF